MPKLADIFQLVACLPNLPEKKNFAREVENSLMRIEAIDPGVRARYAKRLATRARHHKKLVDGVTDKFAQKSVLTLMSDDEENDIRDFHHAVYYSAFFVARFALVVNGSYDCSDHKEIDNRLKQLGATGTALKKDATSLATKLQSWRDSRIIADYTMSTQRIETISQLQGVRFTQGDLSALFSTWSVP